MKFLSIKEYFYKLNTIGFIVLLLPISAFIFLYLMTLQDLPAIIAQDTVQSLLIGATVVLFLDLTIVHWLYRMRINKIKSIPELAKRMDKFYSATMMRMSSYCACSLLMAYGFYLTQSSLFTTLFMLIFLVIILQWPTVRLFCNQLDLNKNEREMIVSSGDLIK